ncbi:MAG: hypothetical protein WAM72_24400 [Xanthobacteraceae bacterium]
MQLDLLARTVAGGRRSINLSPMHMARGCPRQQFYSYWTYQGRGYHGAGQKQVAGDQLRPLG